MHLANRKNNKFLYYSINFARQLLPSALFQARLSRKLRTSADYDAEYLAQRVNYYNKLSGVRPLSEGATRLADLKLQTKFTHHYFDTFEYTRYFDPQLKARFLFGDNTVVPAEPSIVKSRPISQANANAVLLKLGKVRHFVTTRDHMEFANKKDLLVGRGGVHKLGRVRFYQMYFQHPLCNLGQTNKDKNLQWVKPALSLDEHLAYKFILCLEGNDVASNLKWVMSSNSLAVMPRPKYETWFMEGTLIPNHHYVLIKDDYSDLPERLEHYLRNPGEAMQIARNANQYVRQFQDRKREDLISLMVLDKYFRQTGQTGQTVEATKQPARRAA